MNMNMWVLPDLPFQFTRFAFWVWVYDVSEVLTFSSVVILHFIEFFFASCWSSVFFTLIITWYKCKLANRFAWKRRKPIELYERTQKMQIEFERERERNEKKTIKNGVKTWTTGIFVSFVCDWTFRFVVFRSENSQSKSMCVSKIIITFRFEIRSIAMHSSHMITFGGCNSLTHISPIYQSLLGFSNEFFFS